MNIGISYFFGYKELKPEESVRLIKKYNFDCVMTNADKKFNHENGSIKKQIRLLKKNNIKLSSLHMAYNAEDLPHFWMDDRIGKKLEKKLYRDICIAKKYGFTCVVMHLHGKYSEFGIKRLLRVLDYAQKKNVYIANENLRQPELFEKVMDEINHPYLKFCYDSGHNNCFAKGKDYLQKYGDRLVALHLHDNDGTDDQHTLNRFGNIDWDLIAKRLSVLPDINLDYELLQAKKIDMKMEDVLEECYKQGKELEEKITFYRASKNGK